jgi:CDP-glucose 4,6-dehydratase
MRALRKGHTIPVRNKTSTRPWQHVLEPLSGYLWLAASLALADKLGTQASQNEIEMYSQSSYSLTPHSYLHRSSSLGALNSSFNFGPNLNSNRTVAELVQELLKHTGGQWQDHSDPNILHEASKLNLAIDKAFHLLKWQPVWDFKQSIAATAEWYISEARGIAPADLTTQQIKCYHQDSVALGLPWAI